MIGLTFPSEETEARERRLFCRRQRSQAWNLGLLTTPHPNLHASTVPAVSLIGNMPEDEKNSCLIQRVLLDHRIVTLAYLMSG